MAFTDKFVRRPILAIVVSLLILLVGLSALFGLPVRQYPYMESATIQIDTAFPGATQYQVYRTESNGTPAATGLIGTVAGTTFDDKGAAAGAAAAAPAGSWSAVTNSTKAVDRTWDRHCVMSYAGCGGEYPPSNKEYLCGKCLLRHRGWKVQGITTHPGTKVREP